MRLSQQDRDFHYANDLQNEVAFLVDQYAKRGIIKRDDYEFPKRGEDPVSVLQEMKNRLEEALVEHKLPPEAKFKRLETQFRAFRTEVLSRISALEQEAART